MQVSFSWHTLLLLLFIIIIILFVEWFQETDSHHDGMCHIHLSAPTVAAAAILNFEKMSIYPGKSAGNDWKTAFNLHVVESVSGDHNF